MTNVERKELARKLRIEGHVVFIHDRHKTVCASFEHQGHKTIGVAICGPYDIFDLNLGKKIALGRAVNEWIDDNHDCNLDLYPLPNLEEFQKSLNELRQLIRG